MVTHIERMTIPATIDRVEEACEFVNARAREAGLNEDAVYHCHLSLEEILTNVIEHGYEYADGNYVTVACGRRGNCFSITVIDDAVAFNPLTLPDPDPRTPLMEREGGGWGIYFVKKYMDRISYKREYNQNHLTIEKCLVIP